MKQAYYFSHDYGARGDRRLQAIIMRHGIAGIGVFWCIIEMLYEENGYLPLSDCERIAFELRTQTEIVKSIISDFDLFENKDENFYSNSVLSRLNMRNSKSRKAQKSANSRWKKEYANAKRTQCDGNAIKERKIKEKKGKENISPSLRSGEVVAGAPTPAQQAREFFENFSNGTDRAQAFVLKISERYGLTVENSRAELDKFVNYWREKTKDGKRERWELQKTFEVQKRLATWFSKMRQSTSIKPGGVAFIK